MKKSSILIAILLVLSIIILGLSFMIKKQETEIFDHVKNIDFTNKEQIIAIAYLDKIENYTKYLSNYEHLKIYEITNEEAYLIIPRYKDSKINIYEVSFEEDKITKGNLLTSNNVPFVITCNEEGNPNIMLEIKYKDVIFEYSPILENDIIIKNKYILDITEYSEE